MLKRIIGGIMLTFVGVLFLVSCSDNITLDTAKEIELGSSITQVKELLGEPNEQLGDRTYEYYSDNILSIIKEIEANASKVDEIDGLKDLAALLAKEKELTDKLNQTEGKTLKIEFEDEMVISVTFDAKALGTKNDFVSKTLQSYELIQGNLPQYSKTGSVSFETYFTDGSFFKGSSVAELKYSFENTEVIDENHEVVWKDDWGHSYTGTLKVGSNKDLITGFGYYVLGSTIYLTENNHEIVRNQTYIQWADRITDIVVKSGVTRLQNRLPFKNAKNINLCAGIEYISSLAFKDTAFYNDIFNYNNGLLYLDDFLLNYTNTLTSSKNIIIKDSIKFIVEGAFSNQEHIKSIVLPSNLTSIESQTFSGCSNLTSITIPNNVKSIGAGAFDGCRSLERIVLPDSVTSIGGDCFRGCSNLTSITIPNSVKSIGNNVFSYCESLTNVVLPAGIPSIGDYAFYGCSNLTSVVLPDGVTSIGNYAFYSCSSLTSIVIPDSVIVGIGNSAFYGCSSLTSVVIPDGVPSIGDYAFYDCYNLTSVTLGKSLNSIGNNAFYNCFHLVELYNLSSLSIQIGAEDNGGVGLYAKVIHTVL